MSEDELKKIRDLAGDKNTDPEKLNEISKIDDVIIKQNLANNYSTPLSVLIGLVKQGFKEAKPIIASHKDASAEILDWLFGMIGKGEEVLYYGLAENPNSSPILLDQLFDTCESLNSNSTKFIHKILMRNSNTQSKTLEKFMGIIDRKESVYFRVFDLISHPNITSQILERLAIHDDWAFKYQIYVNPKTPESIRNKLKEELDAIEKASKTDNPKVLEDLLKFTHEEIRQEISLNPNCPVAVLTQLALDPNYEVRINVAEHENISEEIFDILSVDEHVCVRSALATQQNIPEHIIKRLLSDDEEVLSSLARNPDISVSIQKEIAKNPNSKVLMGLVVNQNLDIEILRNLYNMSGDWDEDIRSRFLFNIARNKSLPHDIMNSIISLSDNLTKLGLAYNTSLPINLQERLFLEDDVRILYALSVNENVEESLLKKIIEERPSAINIKESYHIQYSDEVLGLIIENCTIKNTSLPYFREADYYEDLTKLVNRITDLKILLRLRLTAPEGARKAILNRILELKR